MSITQEIENSRLLLQNIYDVVEAKGGVILSDKNLNNLSDCIESIPSGGGGGPIEYAIDGNGKMSKATVNFKLPSDAKDLGQYAFYYAFANNNDIETADLSSLTTISGNNSAERMFYRCSKLTSADLSSLTTISGENGAYYMFANSDLTSADLSSLTTVSSRNGAAYMFYSCSKLTSANLSSLTTISGSNALASIFRSCTKLKELSFPALTADSFGSETNQFSDMLSGVTGCKVHFPASTQAKIETMTGYPTFGSSSTVVLFDL